MTRYQYQERVKIYTVVRQGRVIGECWESRVTPGWWQVTLSIDMNIRGKGRTRDKAVDNALAQVGGVVKR